MTIPTNEVTLDQHDTSLNERASVGDKFDDHLATEHMPEYHFDYKELKQQLLSECVTQRPSKKYLSAMQSLRKAMTNITSPTTLTSQADQIQLKQCSEQLLGFISKPQNGRSRKSPYS